MLFVAYNGIVVHGSMAALHFSIMVVAILDASLPKSEHRQEQDSFRWSDPDRAGPRSMPVRLNDVKIVVVLLARRFWIVPMDLNVQFIELFGPGYATVLDDLKSSQRLDPVYFCDTLDFMSRTDGSHC
jgi:hypothetical protein